jgi:gas vesicle protein
MKRGVHFMAGRFIKGLTTGALIGAAAGMMMVPEMSRKTRKMLKRSNRTMMNTAENLVDAMKNMM